MQHNQTPDAIWSKNKEADSSIKVPALKRSETSPYWRFGKIWRDLCVHAGLCNYHGCAVSSKVFGLVFLQKILLQTLEKISKFNSTVKYFNKKQPCKLYNLVTVIVKSISVVARSWRSQISLYALKHSVSKNSHICNLDQNMTCTIHWTPFKSSCVTTLGLRTKLLIVAWSYCINAIQMIWPLLQS